MLKKIMLLIMLSASLYAADQQLQHEGMSAKKMFTYCAVGAVGTAGAVVLAPYVLPAGTVIAIKAVLAAGAAKAAAAGTALKAGAIAAGPVASKINAGITVTKWCVKATYTSPEDKLKKLLSEEKHDLDEAKREFGECLLGNKNAEKDASSIPRPCKGLAMRFALCQHEKLMYN